MNFTTLYTKRFFSMFYQSYTRLGLVMLSSVIGLLFSTQSNAAESSSAPLFGAIDQIISSIKQDTEDLKGQVARVAIFNISISENLSEDIKAYTSTKLENVVSKDNDLRFVACRSCMAIKAETEGDAIIVKKGPLDDADLKKVLGPMNASHYAEVNIAYAGSIVELTLNIFKTADRTLVFGKSYKRRAAGFGHSGMKLSLSFLQIFKQSTPKAYPAGLSLFVAERAYGLGEFGLGGIATAKAGTMPAYVAGGPILRFNLNEIFERSWSHTAILFTTRIHYGKMGSYQDLMYGTGFKIELGSIYHFLLEYAGSIKLESDVPESQTATTQNATSDTEFPPMKQFPKALIFGFGFDLG
jgi:hypothetical protein